MALADTPVSRIESEVAFTLGLESTVREAVDGLKAQRRGAAIVVDGEERLAGIFTERDVLVQSLSRGEGWLDRKMSEAMTVAPVSVGHSDSIAAALHKMQDGHFRHLPVVDEEGRPVAIVSIRDIVGFVADNLPQEILNLPPHPSLEARSPWGA